MTLRADLRSLFVLHPSPVRWPIAVQAGVSMGLPTIGFAIAGREQLGLLASTGAFLALYLTTRSRRERASKLPLIALGFVASAAAGMAVSGSLVASLVMLVVIAAVSATLCLGLGVGPPGGMFFVLVAGLANRLTAPPRLEGNGLDGRVLLGLLLLGLTITYLVVLSPMLLPGVRRRDAGVHEAAEPMRFRVDAITRVILTRLVIASAVAALVAAPLGLHRAYWVIVTAVVVLQNGHRIRLTVLRGAHRVLGTFAGIALFALIATVQPAGVWLGVVLATLQFAVEMVVVRNYGIALALITPLALTIAGQGGADDVSGIVAVRLADTLIGTAIAMLVLLASLVVRRGRAPGPLGE